MWGWIIIVIGAAAKALRRGGRTRWLKIGAWGGGRSKWLIAGVVKRRAERALYEMPVGRGGNVAIRFRIGKLMGEMDTCPEAEVQVVGVVLARREAAVLALERPM